jgi:nucleoid DNA-binding protein
MGNISMHKLVKDVTQKQVPEINIPSKKVAKFRAGLKLSQQVNG